MGGRGEMVHQHQLCISSCDDGQPRTKKFNRTSRARCGATVWRSIAWMRTGGSRSASDMARVRCRGEGKRVAVDVDADRPQ